ncbi:DUF3833 domain-containing protein [Colwellia sp. RSH04]|uniref:DUF3833 domain-containing protein n=1 Tax=Colwellia sp. RSH04 TaxID=2305464 RepID=UPI000E56F577|nr:DUF3833 domain-containing protein [Colwellia sp. RSH04]RHW75038.1 DUF3833 domain-containing protein [Colwellia sp. RSH04]
MNNLTKVVFISLFIPFIFSCSTDINEYQPSGKAFDIKSYFNGNVIAWGMVQDYNKKVSRRFCVEIIGQWQGNEGKLAETFYFDDGEMSYRNWQLIKQDNGEYLGTAEDVKGTAIGKHSGFAFQFQYDLLLTLDDDVYQVSMDDWMYQIDDHRVMNKTSMSKFGIKLADITLFFDKEQSDAKCSKTFS